MDAQLPTPTMDAIPLSGSSFYFSSAADAATTAVSSETIPTADADARASLSSCYSLAAVAAGTAFADANYQ